MNYFLVEGQDPLAHCAFEKLLLNTGEDVLAFCTLTPAVFIGKDVSSNAYNFNNVDGVPLVRYSGMGGPVYFDNGNIKTVFITHKEVGSQQKCNKWIRKSLLDLGFTTTTTGNDIFINGKKICGINFKEYQDFVFLAFFFPITINWEVAARVMNLTKNTTDLRERAISFTELNPDITASDIQSALVNNFSSFYQEELVLKDVAPLSQEINSLIPYLSSDNWILYAVAEEEVPDYG